MMVYESPKAVHFDAELNGKRLNERDPIGLEYRWAAAHRVQHELGVSSMIGLSSDDEVAIDRFLARLFIGNPVRVTRRKGAE